jgi:hypothetical protein
VVCCAFSEQAGRREIYLARKLDLAPGAKIELRGVASPNEMTLMAQA